MLVVYSIFTLSIIRNFRNKLFIHYFGAKQETPSSSLSKSRKLQDFTKIVMVLHEEGVFKRGIEALPKDED